MVVKRHFHQFVQLGVKVFFFNAVIADGQRNVDFFLQVRQRLQQQFQLFVVVFAAQFQSVGNLTVLFFRIGVFVLSESSLFDRAVACVEANDLTQQQRVRDTVRNVERGTQFMRHRMAQSQERVSKSHTRQRGRIVHLFAGNRVVFAVFVGTRQVFVNLFRGFQSVRVREVRRHNGNVSFNRVNNRVITRSGAQSRRHRVDQVRVDNRHGRGQRIVRQRIFDVGFVVGNNRERRYFGTRTGSRRNGDHGRFCTQSGQIANSLADIHKAHGDIFEFDFGLFVHQPHDFARVNRRTAAQRDKAIGFVRFDHHHRVVNRRQGGIGLHVKENLVIRSDFVQNARDVVHGARIEQEAVGYDKGAFFAFQFAQSVVHRPAFEINLGRYFIPQHIFSPFGDGFDVQQVLRTNVFAGGVAAPRTAADGQRRVQFEVEQIADGALRRGGVD